jgi:hydroxylamine reductase
MDMFCFQCQETMKNTGCSVKAGMCGKPADVANLQDLLIFVLKGIAVVDQKGKALGVERDPGLARFVLESLFMTITNANFDAARFERRIDRALEIRDALRARVRTGDALPEAATWTPGGAGDYRRKGEEVGVLSTANEDVRSLRELLTYGIKGIAAYGEHAMVLGEANDAVIDFVMKGLAATTDDGLSADDLVGLVLECGKNGVDVMALLDKANTGAYGHPEPTEVNIGVRRNPGILISGHDLKDMAELLEQTKGTGVDVYTHSEMLPANAYPAFKKYDHFVGNYGNSWWRQKEEIEKFNGPVLFTTNCIVPPKDSYKGRLFTTGCAGYPGATHIPDREDGKAKDFSAVIAMARTCPPPEELESGTIWGGFARNAVMSLAGKVIAAVMSGAIKRFVVMAGCDGRHREREYYSEVAAKLPKDTVILTAGCAKYRYNKLELGDIGGIPRVLDAGQCNDSYSLAYIALQLKAAMGLKDINDLPVSYDVAWYEQKAVIVLLALLSLGVKGIRLGPTLPAFLSPNVAKVLVEKFDIKPISDAASDVEAMMAGR